MRIKFGFLVTLLLPMFFQACKNKPEATGGDASFIHGTDGKPTIAQIEGLLPYALDYCKKFYDAVLAENSILSLKTQIGCSENLAKCSYSEQQFELVKNDLVAFAPKIRRAIEQELIIGFGDQNSPRANDDSEASIVGNQIFLFSDQIRENSTIEQFATGELLASMVGILVHEFEHYYTGLPDRSKRVPQFLNDFGAKESFDLARLLASTFVRAQYQRESAEQSLGLKNGKPAPYATTLFSDALQPKTQNRFERVNDKINLWGPLNIMAVTRTNFERTEPWAYASVRRRPGHCGQLLLYYKGAANSGETVDQDYVMASSCMGDGTIFPLGKTHIGILIARSIHFPRGNSWIATWLGSELISDSASTSAGELSMKFTSSGKFLELSTGGECSMRVDLSHFIGDSEIQTLKSSGAAGIRAYSSGTLNEEVSFSNFMTGTTAPQNVTGNCRFVL